MLLIVLASVLALSLALVESALAARRSAPTSSTITLNEATPHLGGTVSFTSTFPKLPGNTTPRIAVRCYQDGALAYAEARSYTESFTLGGGSSDWLRAGGPASCTAELFYFSYSGQTQTAVSLATTPFEAAGA